MPKARKKILVAPAWPYAAGHRHLGHVAGFGVPSDVFARYHRLKGNDVLMVSGTDEHGTPVMVAADREGKSYAEIADYYNASFRDDFRRLGLSYDLFSRTTTLNHEHVVQDLFTTLYEHGAIVEQQMLVSFSPATGHTLPDRYIEGTCPICGYPEARGDQCDNCGNQLDPTDLINPRSRIDGSVPEFRETNHLFLDLPQFTDRLRNWIQSQTEWRPNVKNFSLGLLDNLRSRPITRDLDWGVRIPVAGYADDPNKRIYVWFDAVVGYLSASIEWAAIRGEPDAWRDWWQNPEAEHSYFQGKDNIVFHTVIWPAMLLGYGRGGEIGAGVELRLPDNVVATEFLTMEGKQFSTSRGYTVEIRDFLDRYDPDPLRYYLVAAGPETQDSDFTWADFVRRNNDELLANWGNLVNRALTNAQRAFGQVPEPGELDAADRAVLASIDAGFESVGSLIEHARFRAALAEAMRLSSEVNQYVSDQAPWSLAKTDLERAATVLYVALRAIDSLKVLFTPFLPHTSQRLHEMLGYEGWLAGPLEFREVVEADGRVHEVLTGDYASWIGSWEPSELPVGQVLGEPHPLFRKLDESVVAEELRPGVIDTHAHLDPEAASDDLARAHDVGVNRVIVVSTTVSGARDALALTERHSGVFASLGIHPHNAADPGAGQLDELAPLLARARAVSVGETGLDYFRDYAPRPAQRSLFERHLELARQYDKPVVIHTRAADADTLAVLAGFDGTVVLHCFSSPALLGPALERGWYVSFAGNVTYPNAGDLREAAAAIPADRLLAETDSPYLSPQPVRGGRNEPAFVVHTLAALAELREVSPDDLAARIDANATAAFGL